MLTTTNVHNTNRACATIITPVPGAIQ
jgi:hypothetical protein